MTTRARVYDDESNKSNDESNKSNDESNKSNDESTRVFTRTIVSEVL